jgi:hypothetical protein
MISQTLSDQEPLDEILPGGPHSQPLAVYVHGDGEKHAEDLNQPNVYKHLLAPVCLEPMREKQRKDKPVENIFRR